MNFRFFSHNVLQMFLVLSPYLLARLYRVFGIVRQFAFVGIILLGATYSLGVQAKLRTFFSGGGAFSENTEVFASATGSLAQQGVASWYGPRFHGRKTANGEIYDMHSFTAAHQTLPLGTVVRVTNLDNNKTVLVRINDRGPYVDGRILDLSYGAAKELGMLKSGTTNIALEVVEGIRLDDSSSANDYLSASYEFTALKELLATTAFGYDTKPIVIEKGSFSVVYETDNFSDVLGAWQRLRKQYGDGVYLAPQRKLDEQIAFEELQRKEEISTRSKKRLTATDKRGARLAAAREERTRLYNYQLLTIESNDGGVRSQSLASAN